MTKRRFLLMFMLVFALIFARYCYFGFEYYPQLDDYIQYHNYTSRGLGYAELISALGLLSVRPLAGLADIFVWSNFFPVMIVAVAAISALFAASACLFYDVFRRRFGTGSLFFVVYALLPLAIEGTYWVSASSRVVVGLFFTSLALWLFEKWCCGGKKRDAAFCAAAQLLAFGFYEQTIVLSFASVLIFGVLNFKPQRKRALLSLCGFANLAIYAVFTRIFSDSSLYGSRMTIANPLSAWYYKEKLPEVLSQLKSAFLGGGFYTLVKGAYRGAKIFAAQPNFIYAIAVLALCVALFIAAKRRDEESESADTRLKPRAALIVGVLLALAPTAPFFLIGETWFSLRGTVMSLCGIALIADTLLRFIPLKKLTAAITAAAALICCVASVSEIDDYRETTANDMAIVALLAETLPRGGGEIAVLNVEPSYLGNQNYYYHEHIHGITESGWALHGGLEYLMGAENAPSVTPLPRHPMYSPWNRDTATLNNFDLIYLYIDGALTQIITEERSDGTTALFAGGEYVGYVWEEDGYGYLELESAATAAS
ncbi:MAG: glucosyltransferase domain-containing protein [Oscillospiraceae bacterium]|jgi:hypothetical protein|nr:glucosyltransferase domain-containing protein [Oscillospiraceae bacterium]